MNITMDYVNTKAQLIFWQTASKAMRLALRHRKRIYQALTFAPVAIVALAAFIIGRGLGMLIEAGVF